MTAFDEIEASCESLLEDLCDLTKYADNIATEKIAAYIQKLPIKTYDYKSTLSLPLFRARYAEIFDRNDPTQFGYIHNSDLIRVFRYNTEHQAVLYTSTSPLTAFKEIEAADKPDSFYLSVWEPKEISQVFHLALNINGNGVVTDSYAGRFYRILKNNVGPGSVQYQCLSALGHLLEEPGTDYRFSSELASLILQSHDALMTTSLKSSGRELNVTFNKRAADELLVLKYLYHCKVPLTDTLAFDVMEIGIHDNNAIKWYNWEIDFDSIDMADDSNCIQKDDLREAIRFERSMRNWCYSVEI